MTTIPQKGNVNKLDRTVRRTMKMKEKLETENKQRNQDIWF